jgi:penicillin-binding protein-related factor A (putative recombinase)
VAQNKFEEELSRSIREQFLWKKGKIPDIPYFKDSPLHVDIPRICDYVVPMVDGTALWIEAKMTQNKSLPYSNFQANPKGDQIGDLVYLEVLNQRVFVLINFRSSDSKMNEVYALTPIQLAWYMRRNKRKSFPIDFCREGLSVTRTKFPKGYGWDLKELVGL